MQMYKCIENIPIEFDYYGNRFGTGTIKEGRIFVVVKNPTPEKKLYKLEAIDGLLPNLIYLRKSAFKKYFKEEKQDE